ncbi:MarR family transcriptional regulator [Rouxiella badensis]|uniref:MarR family winged helix-turn-helix transcriptional regulator n=1 Tax=Rouxiella badensis TaxID=1646377 RepID=UPI001D1474C4|nr:MarR family transcriptional regulator [Rouxiella badensis]MCC3721136.1 MarR family transcriptional regulator [Rouxiella badensis]MCC3730773.1 MarR family transcriptional regulator [Rouxiella badensis]MCC3742911.1 MarR family transcriptional regulator [Rouxiella badensis]
MSDAANIWALNHRVLTLVMNECAEQLASLRLETKEFFVLGEIEPCRYPAELAKRLMLPKASVTVYLRNLVAKKFVRREIDEGDLRRHRLVLTSEGRRALDAATLALSSSFEKRLTRLKAQERAELERLLSQLV